MSDEPSQRTDGSGGRRSLRRELSAGFRRAIGLTALGTVLPGAGLTRTRSRAWGWGLLAVFLASVAAVAYLLLTRGPTSVGLVIASNTRYLLALTVVLAVGGFIWCASIIATAVQSRPRRLDRARTRSLAVFTTLMVVLVGGASYKGAEFALIGRDTVDVIFKDSPLRPGQGAHVAEGEDPWADTPRVNILLLGSDAGVGRDGTRTDSMIVASTDTKTGRTVLISLPRNLQRVPLRRRASCATGGRAVPMACRAAHARSGTPTTRACSTRSGPRPTSSARSTPTPTQRRCPRSLRDPRRHRRDPRPQDRPHRRRRPRGVPPAHQRHGRRDHQRQARRL